MIRTAVGLTSNSEIYRVGRRRKTFLVEKKLRSNGSSLTTRKCLSACIDKRAEKATEKVIIAMLFQRNVLLKILFY